MLSFKDCPHEWTKTLSKKHNSCHLCSQQYLADHFNKELIKDIPKVSGFLVKHTRI